MWNEEKIQQMATMWAEGKTASHIAQCIGAASRNAVIGKLHRLGLSGNQPSRKDRAPPRNRPPLSTKRTKRAEPRKPKASAKLHLLAEPLPPAAETDIPRVSMDDSTDKVCKWVCADFKDMTTPMYCGCAVTDGLPYCEHHARRAYRADAPAQTGGFIQRKGRALHNLTSPIPDNRVFEEV